MTQRYEIAIANQPARYQIDADYKKRKNPSEFSFYDCHGCHHRYSLENAWSDRTYLPTEAKSLRRAVVVG